MLLNAPFSELFTFLVAFDFIFAWINKVQLVFLSVRSCLLRVGLVEVLLGLLDWRAGGRNGLCSQMKWNESEASIGRVLAVEVCSYSMFVYHKHNFF